MRFHYYDNSANHLNDTDEHYHPIGTVKPDDSRRILDHGKLVSRIFADSDGNWYAVHTH